MFALLRTFYSWPFPGRTANSFEGKPIYSYVINLLLPTIYIYYFFQSCFNVNILDFLCIRHFLHITYKTI